MKKINLIATLLLLIVAGQSCEEGKIADENPLQVIEKPVEPEETLPEWVETIANPHREWVTVFPGEISKQERRIQDTTITLKPYYKKPSPNSSNPTPFFSTGLYAPAAEVITVNVPAGLTGVEYRIGVWPCDLDHPCVGGDAVENQKRYYKIYVKGKLEAGENKISSYFGGQVYLIFPQQVEGEHTFGFKGCVKSPDFIKGGNAQEWKNMLAQTSVPWGELRGERFICTFPLEMLKTVNDPQRLVEFYDKFIYYSYDEVFGFSQDPNAPDNMRAILTPWRVCLDIQQCGGAAHSGYPFVAGWNSDQRWVQPEELEAGNMWGLWHEIGHNFQNPKWKWNGLGEVTCNLNIFSWYCRFCGYWATGSRLDEFKATVENYVLNTPNDTKDNTTDLTVGQLLVPFVQLAYGLDWGVYKYLGIQNRTSTESTSSDQEKRDFFARRVCEYANANLLPFFDDWGFKISKEARCYLGKFPAWETTERGLDKGEFWKSFDYGPVTDPSIVDIYHEPDPTQFPNPEYDCGPKPISRADWTILGFFPKQYGSASSYGPQLLLDDDLKTKFATSADNGKSWPGYVVFDMQKEYNLGGVSFAQRDGTGSANTRPGTLKVYVSTQAPVDGSGQFDPNFAGWQLLLEANLETNGDRLQNFELAEEEEWLRARYVKCEVLNPKTSGGNPCWAEFSVSGKE